MQKFSFTDDPGNGVIRHNLEPEMLIQVIYNREAPDLLIYEDCFELFEFRGNEIILKWLADYDELDAIEDYTHIRSILRRAFKWYKSKVFIEEKKKEPELFTTARYSLTLRIWRKGEEKKYDWLLYDKIFHLHMMWMAGNFNESQIIETLPEFESENILPQLLREAAEWLVAHHREKL
jgi:hypothetical protein